MEKLPGRRKKSKGKKKVYHLLDFTLSPPLFQELAG